ncbi:MAG: hypothetical protein VW875_16660 [Planctomycetaceae bacterium]
MAYAFAFVCPPLAMFVKLKLVQAILCSVIWGFGVVLGFTGLGIPVSITIHICCIIWGFAVVGGANADKRQRKLVRALRQP